MARAFGEDIGDLPSYKDTVEKKKAEGLPKWMQEFERVNVTKKGASQ